MDLRSSTPPSKDTSLGLRVHRIEIPSGEIAYIDEGAGPPVVLLHGAPLTSLGFVRVVRGLRARHRVVAPDLPGFGHSRASTSFDGSLAAYARSIEEFCRCSRLEDFVLFVFDSSGCTGLAAAAKLASKIEGLVIADTVPIPLTGRAWFVKMILRHIVSTRIVRWLNRSFNLLPWLVATVDPIRRRFTASERAVLIGQYDSPEKRDRVIDMFSAMAHDDAFMREVAAGVALHLAHKPALLLFGQLDPVRFAGGVSRFRKMFRRATVRIIGGEKHFPILAAGDEVAAAVAAWMSVLRPAREAVLVARPHGATSIEGVAR